MEPGISPHRKVDNIEELKISKTSQGTLADRVYPQGNINGHPFYRWKRNSDTAPS